MGRRRDPPSSQPTRLGQDKLDKINQNTARVEEALFNRFVDSLDKILCQAPTREMVEMFELLLHNALAANQDRLIDSKAAGWELVCDARQVDGLLDLLVEKLTYDQYAYKNIMHLVIATDA